MSLGGDEVIPYPKDEFEFLLGADYGDDFPEGKAVKATRIRGAKFLITPVVYAS